MFDHTFTLITIFTFSSEHIYAVKVPIKDELNISIGVAVGSSIVGLVIVYFRNFKNGFTANCSLRFSVWLNILFISKAYPNFFLPLKGSLSYWDGYWVNH